MIFAILIYLVCSLFEIHCIIHDLFMISKLRKKYFFDKVVFYKAVPGLHYLGANEIVHTRLISLRPAFSYNNRGLMFYY